MKFLPYILNHLRGTWLRTSLTVLAMALCIFLFCVIQTFIGAINAGLRAASDHRLVVRNAISLVFPMPVWYGERIATVPGVRRVGAASWFGGVYRDPRNFFPNFAIDAENYLAMYPEYMMPAEQRQAFMADRRGCVVGRETADRFGWKVGDTFQLVSSLPTYQGAGPMEFVVRAIYDTDRSRYPATSITQMFFHYEYLYEAAGRTISPGSFTVIIDDPSRAGTVSAAIDALFENSDAQTKTETESAFRAGFVALAGNLALLLHAIGLAVTFTILLVAANTMTMAVRERRREIAVLKTLGYPSGLVLRLVLAESLAIGVLGGLMGTGAAAALIAAAPGLPTVGDFLRGFSGFGLKLPIMAASLGLALTLALLAGSVPALLAFRTRIVETLRQV